MVRDNKKIYAEPNDEDTVIKSNDLDMLDNNCLVVGNGDKRLEQVKDSTQYGSIIYLVDGVMQLLQIQPNKTLGIDTNGNLAWL